MRLASLLVLIPVISGSGFNKDHSIAILGMSSELRSLSPERIYANLKDSTPGVSVETIQASLKEYIKPVIVPGWFHRSLSLAFPTGTIDPEEPSLYRTICAAKPSSSARFENRDEMLKSAKAWIIHCINPTRLFGDTYCHRYGDRGTGVDAEMWQLSEQSLFDYLGQQALALSTAYGRKRARTPDESSSTIPTTSDPFDEGTTDPIPIRKRILQILAADLSTDQFRIARELGISVTAANWLRDSVIKVYIQPVWFVEILEGYGGNEAIALEDLQLFDRVLVAMTEDPSKKLAGDVLDVIQVWVEAFINPSRKSPGDYYSRATDEIVVGKSPYIIAHLNSLLLTRY